MSERTEEELYGFLYKMEEWAWEQLRKDGLTDDKIWDLVLSEETNLDNKPHPEAEHRHYSALLIWEITVMYDRLNDDDFSQSAVDWVSNGWVLGLLRVLASLDSYDERLKHSLQVDRARLPRKRKDSLQYDIVRHVMANAGPDEKIYSFFREYIGRSRTLKMAAGTFDVTPEENDRDTPIAFVVENRGVDSESGKSRKRVPASTIRSAISRLFPKNK